VSAVVTKAIEIPENATPSTSNTIVASRPSWVVGVMSP
jgi:hypothetical protein